MYYPATFTPHTDGTGRYDVTFADLPGCVSQGASLEDAIRMAQEALGLHIGSMVEDGDTLPEPSSLEGARRKDEQEAKEREQLREEEERRLMEELKKYDSDYLGEDENPQKEEEKDESDS